MDSQANAHQRLPLLDGLRGIAAISVMLYHVHNVFGSGQWFQAGYLAVDLFFLLSGFVLTLVAEPRMHRGLGVRGFLDARIRRLWPMIAIGVLVGAAVQFHLLGGGGVVLAIYALLGLLLVPAIWQRTEIYPLNGPQWSLLWELLANLVHAAILVRLGRQSLAAIVVASGIGLFAAILWRGSNTFGPNGDWWWLGSIRVTFSYCAGILVAREWRRGNHPLVAWWVPLTLPFALIAALPFLPIPLALADALVVTLAFPLLFWLAVHASRPSLSAQSWLQRLGAISFPLYGIHMPLLLLFAANGTSAASAIAAVCFCLSVAAVMAWVAATVRLPLRRSRAKGAPLQSA